MNTPIQKTPLIATLDVAQLSGAPLLKLLLFLTLHGPSTVEEVATSRVLDVEGGAKVSLSRARTIVSGAVSDALVIKCPAAPWDKKCSRGASPRRYKVSAHGVEYLRKVGFR